MRPAEVLVAPDPRQTVSGDSYTNRENCHTPQLEPKTATHLVKIVDQDPRNDQWSKRVNAL